MPTEQAPRAVDRNRESAMTRKILAVVGGFVLWSVLWLLLGRGLTAGGLLPAAGEPVSDPAALLALLAGSVGISGIAGYAAAAISRGRGVRIAVALGLVLLLVGAVVQAGYWRLLPLWYHVAFLACLVPACIAGARARSAPARA